MFKNYLDHHRVRTGIVLLQCPPIPIINYGEQIRIMAYKVTLMVIKGHPGGTILNCFLTPFQPFAVCRVFDDIEVHKTKDLCLFRRFKARI